MNIPDEVKLAALRETARDGWMIGKIDPALVFVAEWARKEALREAEAEVHAIPCWGNGKESGFDVGPDPVRVVRDTMRRLVEGALA